MSPFKLPISAGPRLPLLGLGSQAPYATCIGGHTQKEATQPMNILWYRTFIPFLSFSSDRRDRGRQSVKLSVHRHKSKPRNNVPRQDTRQEAVHGGQNGIRVIRESRKRKKNNSDSTLWCVWLRKWLFARSSRSIR